MFTQRYGGYATPLTTQRSSVQAGDVSAAVRHARGIQTPVGEISRPVGSAIDAQRLMPVNSKAIGEAVYNPEVMRKIPQASYSPSQYGDLQVLPVILAASTDLLVLARPTHHRIFLLIQNTLAANILYFTFDNKADASNAIQIQPGGNAFFDTVVPQNDLHLFATVAGAVIVSFINVDLANPL